MTLTFAVLGDSIAYGQGATRPDETLAARLAGVLTASGVAVEVHMLAVPGARSDSLAAQVNRALALRPGLALIVIGANDVTHFVPPELAASQLGACVATLRAAAIEVVVVPAPDFSVLPWLPPAARALVRAASHTLQQAQTRTALSAGATVADLLNDLQSFSTDSRLYSADRFHPSGAGYALIAAALAPTILAAARCAVA